ncbi:hypothetical protein [Microseira wollei]|uniref:Uncharacterized protein n=1 Tax=Microseira wollei NIES-4236 TaxID=2530354 RepID=A0AAV3XH77_9CYAN|nr:hypothetical protein [Microseira wollei]GET40305.1 hypothetical protein MiSe_51140 [Microseira wollei NIES-4236]
MLQTDLESGNFPFVSLEAADSLLAGTDDYEVVRVLVIGSHRGVNSTIRTLYVVRVAQISEWSPLLPAPGSGEVMSILTRRIKF